MKKFLILVVPLGFLVVIGGGLWLFYGRVTDSFTRAQEMIDRGDLRGASIELRATLRANPNNAAAHFRLGQVVQRSGDPVAAEKEYKIARDKGFEARLVNPLLAQAYMSQGRFRELLRDFSPQGLPADQAAPLHTIRAMAQLSLGEGAAALASAAEAERQAPTSPEAALASARIMIAQKDFDNANSKVDRALTLNPRSQEALIIKGQLLNVKGDRLRALESFDSVLAFNPRNLTARLERANLLILDGKDARARIDVAEAVKIEPRSSMALYLRAVLSVKSEDYASADADLSKLGSFLARFPRGFFFYAITKYNIGQAEQASDAANKYLARNPEEPDAIKLYCRIELAARRYSGVIAILNKSQRAGVADADMLDLLGRAYALAGKTDLALRNLERASALAPTNHDILTRLATLRLSLGDASRAAGEFERVLDLSPTQMEAAEQLILAAIYAGEIDRALSGLERLRRVQGESESAGNLAALIRMAQLDLAGATKILLDTIKTFPDAIQPRINLAKVMILQDRGNDAQTALGEVLDRKPAELVALDTLVNLLSTDGRFGLALARLEAARAAAPKNPDVAIALANHHIRTNEPRKALTQVDEALKLLPGNESLLSARARLSLSLGEPEAAEVAYRDILELSPLDHVSRRALADLRVGAKDLEGARAILEDGLKADPGNNELMQAIIKIALRGGLESALATADRLTLNPANMPNARWLRGDALMAAGRFTDAIGAYAGDFRADPTTESLLRLVNAFGATGRTDQATGLLRNWLDSHPEDAAVAEQLAALDIVARRFFEAEKQLGLVLAQRPSDSNALNNLAWVYQQRNDSRARIVAQKSYLLRPNPEAADTLGWILVTSGDVSTGLALLRQSFTQLRNDPTVAFHFASALAQTARRDEAISVLRTIVGSLAEFEDRPNAQRLLNELSGR